MKHRACSKNALPSHTLARCILAGLAAGVFTLGSVPCAAADQVVTEDATVVVGDSTGNAATVTVGTAGGGDTPQIGVKDTDGKLTEGGFVIGTFRRATSNSKVQLTGGKVFIKSGVLGEAHGIRAELGANEDLHIEGGQVEMSGGTLRVDKPMNSNLYRDAFGLFGAIAELNPAPVDLDHGTPAKAEVTGSTVKITGGKSKDPRTNPRKSQWCSIAGGAVAMYDAGTLEAKLSGNKADVQSGDFRQAFQKTKVFGAFAQIKQMDGSALVKAENNTVTLSNLAGSEAGSMDTMFAGARIDYLCVTPKKKASEAEANPQKFVASGNVQIVAKGNKALLDKGKVFDLWGASIEGNNRYGRDLCTEATGNAVSIGSKGNVVRAIGARIEQRVISRAGVSQTVKATDNVVTMEDGGSAVLAMGVKIDCFSLADGSAQAWNEKERLQVNLERNKVTGTGGEWQQVTGADATVISDMENVEGIVRENTVRLERGFLKDGSVTGGVVSSGSDSRLTKTTVRATAEKNEVFLKKMKGDVDRFMAASATANWYNAAAAKAEAKANENTLTVEGGTFTMTESPYATSSMTGAKATVNIYSEALVGTAEASKNTVFSSADAVWQSVTGGKAFVSSTTSDVTATASHNQITLESGTYQGEICGGSVKIRGKDSGSAFEPKESGMAFAQAVGNKINIRGGVYKRAGAANPEMYIYAARADLGSYANSKATVRDNVIEISGTPDLSGARLVGASAVAATRDVAGNTLIVNKTKGIRAVSIEGFQKVVFKMPKGMTASDTMLTVTDTKDTDLRGALLEAHLRGDEPKGKLRLLHTENAQILTDDATKMDVYRGAFDVTGAKLSVAENKKELLVRTPEPVDVPEPSTPSSTPFEEPSSAARAQVEDNRKSVLETVAGSAAFLGTGADLLTGEGMASASLEAAAAPAQTFAPFAAVGGSSMRYQTGSHVDMKAVSLSLGFSREVTRGDDRLVFGPVVEYGRSSYDSYVNAAHAEGKMRYIGGGFFVRQEKADGMFSEGSLRFGRSSVDYSANLNAGLLPIAVSYDMGNNYIGAHLGFGQRITQASGTEREMYLRYFYTRQNGATVDLNAGTRFDFDSVDSHRVRTGARWMIPQKGGSLVLGTSLQYEFGGKTHATVTTSTGTYNAPSPSIQGFSASMEVGWKADLSSQCTADIGLEGWVGKQRGLGLKAGFAWKF